MDIKRSWCVTSGEPDISRRSRKGGSDTMGVYLEQRKHKKITIAKKVTGGPLVFSV